MTIDSLNDLMQRRGVDLFQNARPFLVGASYNKGSEHPHSKEERIYITLNPTIEFALDEIAKKTNKGESIRWVPTYHSYTFKHKTKYLHIQACRVHNNGWVGTQKGEGRPAYKSEKYPYGRVVLVLPDGWEIPNFRGDAELFLRGEAGTEELELVVPLHKLGKHAPRRSGPRRSGPATHTHQEDSTNPSTIYEVYIMNEVGSDRPIKIGKTASAEERLRALQCGNPNPLEYAARFKLNTKEDMDHIESKTHHTFEHKRLEGGQEWFDLTISEGVSYIIHTFGKTPT